MGRTFYIAEDYRKSETIEIAITLLEYYLKSKDSYNKGLITYGDLCKRLSFDMNPRVVDKYLGEISYACKENGLPPISALVYSKDGNKPGAGFFKAYCPEKSKDWDVVWKNYLDEINACQEWNNVLDAYKKLG